MYASATDVPTLLKTDAMPSARALTAWAGMSLALILVMIPPAFSQAAAAARNGTRALRTDH